MTELENKDGDKWAILKFFGVTLVTMLSAFIVLFGGNFFSNYAAIPAMQTALTRNQGDISELRTRTEDRYTGAEARSAQRELESELRVISERIVKIAEMLDGMKTRMARNEGYIRRLEEESRGRD